MGVVTVKKYERFEMYQEKTLVYACGNIFFAVRRHLPKLFTAKYIFETFLLSNCDFLSVSKWL